MSRAKKPTQESAAKPERATQGKERPKTQKKQTTPEKKRGGGRKPAWEALEMDTKLEAVRGWAMQGATMIELADMLGVHVSTLYDWQDPKHRQYHREFADAVRAGRYVAAGQLVASAFKQCMGFLVKETKGIKVKKWEWVKDPETGRQEFKQQEYLETYETEAFIPPNPHITQFMLKNWLPEHFRDKHEVETSTTETPNFVDDLTGKP